MAREYVVENNDFSEFEHLTLNRVDRNGTTTIPTASARNAAAPVTFTTTPTLRAACVSFVAALVFTPRKSSFVVLSISASSMPSVLSALAKQHPP